MKRTRNSASTKRLVFPRVNARLANTRLIQHRRSRRSRSPACLRTKQRTPIAQIR